MPDANYPLSGGGSGASSQRSDLAPGAPLQKVPRMVQTGQPYGSAKQQEQMQAQRPLNNGLAASSQAVTAAARAVTQPHPRPHPGGRFAQTPVQGTPQDILGAISSHPTQHPERPVNFGVATGSPRIQATKELLGHLEGLMQGARHVPANVITLYNRLRNEAAAPGPNTPKPYQPPPLPRPGTGRQAPSISPAHPITPAPQQPAP